MIINLKTWVGGSMKVEKAGCILVNKDNNKIGLIYRSKQKDYSFPKGHKEKGETLEECAIRETTEETKRKCVLYSSNPIAKEQYFDSKNDEVDMYYFLGIDNGQSDNCSLDTHELIWVSFEDVENILSYDSLKSIWQEVKEMVLNILR